MSLVPYPAESSRTRTALARLNQHYYYGPSGVLDLAVYLLIILNGITLSITV